MTQAVQAVYRKILLGAAWVVLSFIMFSNAVVSAYATAPPLHSGYDLPVDAPAAVLMDLNTGIVIYDKNMHERHYPASMTKVMTALLTLEAFADDLDARVPFSHDAVFSIHPSTSNIAMNDNETLSVREALYAIMLPSANEVSNALAELVAGNMDDFALMMTARAIELGAHNTNFTNAHGLHCPDHFTTAYDMALIMRAALQFPVFAKIISTVVNEIPPTERQPDPRPLLNSNHMIRSASQHYNPNVVGGKTGFTDEARHTLVTYGRLRNMGLVSVVLRQERTLTFQDTTTLLNFGFDNFENVLVFDRHSYTREIPVVGQVEPIRAIGERTLTMALPIGVSQHLRIAEDIPPYIEWDVHNGDQIGSVTIWYGDIEISTIRMFAEVPTVFVPEIYTPIILPDTFYDNITLTSVLFVAIQVLLVLVGALAAIILLIHYKSKQSRLRRFRDARTKQMFYYKYK